MTKSHVLELNNLCTTFRKDVLTTLYQRQTGHPGGSLSVCEILTALYFGVMNVNPADPQWEERDRLVLSKGHAAPMLYRVLAGKGFFPEEEMQSLRTLDTRLQGHPCALKTPGVDATTGPLGMGLSVAMGMAISLKLKQSQAYVYAVLGDGEINEGTIWEAVMAAAKFRVDHLCAILDYNKVQLDGTCEDVMPTGDLQAKFEAFGWHVVQCDGHDIEKLCAALEACKTVRNQPSIVIAHTVKGKGVSFMEGQNSCHGKPIDDASFKQAMKELEVTA